MDPQKTTKVEQLQQDRLARGPPGDEGVDGGSETGDATEGRGRSASDGGQVKR